MILQVSIGFCLILLLFCEPLPTSSDSENDGLGDIGVNVANKGEKLEAEIERIGKDMQPESVIAHEVNVELKVNDEFDLKSNLENLTLEKTPSSTTTERPVEQDEDQEDHEEPGNERSDMKINDEFDLKKNLESFAREATTTTTTTSTSTTTVEPVVITEEPRVEHHESEKTEGDAAPILPEVTDELYSKEKFEKMAMEKLPVSTTTENPLVGAYEPAVGGKEASEHEQSEHDDSFLKPKNEKHLENLPMDSPTLPAPTTTAETPTTETDDFENDVKESEDSETLRHPNENVFDKFSETLRNRILPEGTGHLEPTEPSRNIPVISIQEPEIHFKPASVSDDSDSDKPHPNVPRTKHFKHRTDQQSDGYIPGVPDSILVTTEPKKPEEQEERSRDTIRNRIEVVEVKDEDDDWISWDLIHMLLLLSPYDDDEITWWTIMMEAVKCSLRNCPTNNTHWHHRSVDLPRITRHRRQDSEFNPEDTPATTPKPCLCKDLEGYFEKMYESIRSKPRNETA